MNEQQGLYGQIDIDKLWSMIQACPELVKTYKTRDGAEHHAINVNVGYRKQPSQNGDVAYIQIACKAAERKYDSGAYYVGDLKQSGQSSGSGNQPPMATNAPWGAPAPAPQQATPAPQYGQQAPPQPQSNMPFPPPQPGQNQPF